jgi:protein-L-isoaspartate(D-aspartate) O-methyltransferase
MVDGQIITVGVTDRRLIGALRAIPRQRFVPVGMKLVAHIDSDVTLKEATPYSPSRFLMAAGPFAQLVQEAKIRRQDVVLDVGCATGYSSAVLARLADFVIAVESDEALAALATEILADLGVDNVAVNTGPLEAGWLEGSPYDVILIEGSIEKVPAALTEQLTVGGRLVGVIGRGYSASGTVYTKSRSTISSRRAFNATVRSLPGFDEPKVFAF